MLLNPSQNCSTYYWKGSSDLTLTKWTHAVGLVKSSSLGLNHTALLTNGGKVFCCGSNTQGQLGVGAEITASIEPLEVPVPIPAGSKIVCIAAGLNHTICGLSDGSVFGWGDNHNSQCGGFEDNYNVPFLLHQFESPVVKVACSHYSSFCLLENGKLYAWGSGPMLHDNRLSTIRIAQPETISFIEGRFVLDVSCGSNFVVVVVRKANTQSRKISKKNNYVLVHTGSTPPKGNSEPSANQSRTNTQCPLGLDMTVEHVFVPSLSTSQPPSRRSSITSSSQVNLSHAASTDSIRVDSAKITPASSEEFSSHMDEDSEQVVAEQIALRTRSTTLVSQLAVFNVDQSEAKRWFKEHIGEDFNDESETAVDEGRQPCPTNVLPRARSSLQPLVSSVWNGIASSSQAVTAAVHGHLTNITGRLGGSGDQAIAADLSNSQFFGLEPLIKSKPHRMRSASVDSGCSTLSDSSANLTAVFKMSSRASETRKRLPRSSLATQNAQPKIYECKACINTEVMSWGSGNHGQLGHNDCLDRLQPQVITGLDNNQIFRVISSDRTTVALSSDGRVYGWGDNSSRQILYNDKPMVSEPTVISITDKVPVQLCGAGADHTVLSLLISNQHATKAGIFYFGKSNLSILGSRMEFVKKLGAVSNLAAGPNGISCITTLDSPPEWWQHLNELQATEVYFYRLLKEMIGTLVDPIIQADFMAAILASPFGDSVKSLLEALFLLADQIGLNSQSLLNLNDYDIRFTPFVGNTEAYLKYFTNFSIHYHNFLAMNGLRYLVQTAKTTLLRQDTALCGLLDRCDLDYEDDLEVKVGRLLQLPLRRVAEYHALLERVQLHIEDGESLNGSLSILDQGKATLSSHYDQAESTRTFWEKCPKHLADALKEPARRIIRESKALPLSLVGGNKLQSNWFALFNDIFVHIQASMVTLSHRYTNDLGSVHRVYPLEKLWVEASEAGTSKHEIRLTMPEANLTLSAHNTAEKVEWIWILNQTISSWLSTMKAEKNGSTAMRSGTVRLEGRNAPMNRVASHMFYKVGSPLNGAIYKGQWYRGIMHGDGELTWPTGAVYSGNFKDGQRTGYGKYTYKCDGKAEVKEGSWLDGKLHGRAKIKFANGDIYSGFLKNDLPHGHGTFKNKQDSSIYIGEWKEGKRHGYGVLDHDGEKYLGQWANDQKNGSGLQVTLDGSYVEGTYLNNKLTGQGLIMTCDDTYYEGQFLGGNEIHGKGVMYLSNGDSITGQLDGTWSDSIKIINGVFSKCRDTEKPKSPPPKLFATLCTPPEAKWTDLFRHSLVALGLRGNEELVDCEKAWEKVAILVVNLKQHTQHRHKKGSELLETIPQHNVQHLTTEHYHYIQKYVLRAGESELHPLGLLMKGLVSVYRTSYSGTGTHPRLLVHATAELMSLTYRYYDVVRVLFPELPSDANAKRIFSERYDPDSPMLPECEPQLITPAGLLFPLFLPRVYEPLFYLYVTQNAEENDKYWKRIQRFNKQSDPALLSYLGVNKKFWFLGDRKQSETDSVAEVFDVREECYTEAIESLQKLSTCLTPADKISTVYLTFSKIDELVQEKNGGAKFVWSMDDLIPVFLFVVIRSRLRYLGPEIQYMEDLMDRHLEHGELGLMFTTLKACHLQILTEKLFF